MEFKSGIESMFCVSEIIPEATIACSLLEGGNAEWFKLEASNRFD